VTGANDGPVQRFDDRLDAALEGWRGRPLPDAVFSTASHLGDFSALWHLVALGRMAARPSRWRQSLAFAAALGAESLAVNQGLKRLFRRTRPTEAGDERFEVRKPSTSAFPSGHASSAFFAATVLTGWDGKRSAPLWFGIAGVVAASRAYVRIHHPSDVVGGAVVGVALGLVARRVLRRVR
jgi:undecaprenyl-diphosphatase